MPPLLSRFRRVTHALLRAPLFTTVAIITLAVGIGANTAIFSVVYAVLLKPLPFDQPERLVGVWHTAPGLNIPLLNQGPATYLTYREENRVFEQIGMWDNALGLGDRPRRAREGRGADGHRLHAAGAARAADPRTPVHGRGRFAGAAPSA